MQIRRLKNWQWKENRNDKRMVKPHMRKILYRKMMSLQNRRKAISVLERSEDKECKTYVKKNFVYIVTPNAKVTKALNQPDIYIKKSYDTRTKEERFSFKIKGSFYISREESCFLVSFCHSLNIHIMWKSKVISPKSVPTFL